MAKKYVSSREAQRREPPLDRGGKILDAVLIDTMFVGELQIPEA